MELTEARTYFSHPGFHYMLFLVANYDPPGGVIRACAAECAGGTISSVPIYAMSYSWYHHLLEKQRISRDVAYLVDTYEFDLENFSYIVQAHI